MTGMQLLALEDQAFGLIDAGFMQFYQGCEALCRDPEGKIKLSKKFIAANASSDGRSADNCSSGLTSQAQVF